MSDKEFEIREAKREDMTAVAALIMELAEYEGLTDDQKLSAKDLERDGFDATPPLFRCAVASCPDGPLVGYALYFYTYSTCTGAAGQLEDIYVTPRMRGKGVGGKLFDYVVQQVSANGGTRLDFHVLSWNPARQFYEKRGANNLNDEWCYYRLDM